MRNIQVIDGAINSTFDVYAVCDDVFAVLFPSGQDVAFADEADSRRRDLGLNEVVFWGEVYARRVKKTRVSGIHGTLHLADAAKEHFPSRREEDVHGPLESQSRPDIERSVGALRRSWISETARLDESHASSRARSMRWLSELEGAVLDKLLAGEHPILAQLRAQAGLARVADRKLSEVGFLCDFELPEDVPRVGPPSNFELDDVSAVVDGLAHAATFVLLIRDGQIATLAGFSRDEPWPEAVGGYSLAYDAEPRVFPFA